MISDFIVSKDDIFDISYQHAVEKMGFSLIVPYAVYKRLYSLHPLMVIQCFIVLIQILQGFELLRSRNRMPDQECRVTVR